MQWLETPLYQPLTGLGQGIMSLTVDFNASGVCDAEEIKWLKSMEALNCRLGTLVSWDLAEGGRALMRSYFSCKPCSTLSPRRAGGMSGMKGSPFSSSWSHLWSVKCILLLSFFLFLFLISYCASLSSFPCSAQFSSSTFIPHRMRYVLPKRIRRSHEWDRLLCPIWQCSYAVLFFPWKIQ